MMSTKKNYTRETILKAAWKILDESPRASSRMSDIAKEAGISRQAVYLHFPTRAELLIATARYVDEVYEIDERLRKSRNATTGKERLSAYIEAWGNYLPCVDCMASAFLAMPDDDDAMAAWNDRMAAVRHGCLAAIEALAADDDLTASYTVAQATDILWMLLSIQNWQLLTVKCGWSQADYVSHILEIAQNVLVKNC